MYKIKPKITRLKPSKEKVFKELDWPGALTKFGYQKPAGFPGKALKSTKHASVIPFYTL